MTNMHTGRDAASERGMALIAVLLLLLMISSLGAALAMSGNTETLIAKNQENSAQARTAGLRGQRLYDGQPSHDRHVARAGRPVGDHRHRR
jgi:type II secretory pathway component PulK